MKRLFFHVFSVNLLCDSQRRVFFSIIKYGNSCKNMLYMTKRSFAIFVVVGNMIYWNLKQLAFCDLLNNTHCIYFWRLLVIGYNHCSISFLCVSDSPQTPINFTGYSFTNNFVNLTWFSGFNGGNDQFFIVHLKDGSTWRELTNVTYQMEGRKVQFDHGPLTPGREYWFRLKSCNTINCSSTPADVRAVVKGKFLFLI